MALLEEIQKKIKFKAQEQVVADSDFLQAADLISKKINDSSHLAKNEAEVVSGFDLAFIPFIKDFIGIEYRPEKEIFIDGIKYNTTGRTNSKGRIDSRIGSLVIEFKHRDKLKKDTDINKAVAQIQSYIDSLNSEGNQRYVGVLTDGINYLIRDTDGILTSKLQPLDKHAIKKICGLLVLLNKKALHPKNIVDDFCYGNPSLTSRLISNLLSALENNITGRSQMLFNEWKELFRLAHDDKSLQTAILERRLSLEKIAGHKLFTNNDEYKVLYALQTAYAIIVKVIAYKTLSGLVFENDFTFSDMIKSNSESMRNHLYTLEEGAIFRKCGILNLLEGDFFSWYCTKEQWGDEIFRSIKDVFSLLSEYEEGNLFKEGEKVYDLFKDLYMNIIPDKVRHSLGEFYTPEWLAEHLISSTEKHVINKNNWTAIDPCCGSGTFIITLLGKVLQRNHVDNKAKLKDVISSVKGIDLNPLAALTARINYFINISHLLDNDSEIEIPIYLGDASYVPEKVILDGIDCLRYEIHTLQGPIHIEIPNQALSNSHEFSKVIVDIERFIKLRDRNGVFNKFVEISGDIDNSQVILDKLRILSDKFVELEERDWNGIWARIVTNFLTTANLGKFDMVVGNPPWIDWKNLPAGYRDRIKSLCLSRSLFSGDRLTGGINLNICALISNVSAENWLKNEGILAFLMPQNILFQQTYEGFRKFNFGEDQKLYLQEIYDWSESGHPFKPVTIKFATYIFASKNVDYLKGIPLTFMSKNKTGRSLESYSQHTHFNAISHEFSTRNEIAGTVTSSNTAFTYATDCEKLIDYRKISGYCEYHGREGIEFFPQELFLWKYKNKKNSSTAFFENYQGGKSKYKVAKQMIVSETKYLYPLIKGTNIEPFGVKDIEYFVPFPYREMSRKPIPLDELVKESPMLADYFINHKQLLESQTRYNDKIIGKSNITAFYALARVGEYTYGDHFVCFRDNTKWAAAVVSQMDTPWGEKKRPLFQNHAVSISQRQDGKFITSDEAHYICAIFNSSITAEYILKSSDSRTFKIRPPINVPLYNETNIKHYQLSLLSKKAHEAKSKNSSLNGLIMDINELVKDLFS